MAVLGTTYNPNLGNNDYNYAYQVWKNVNFENNSIKVSPEELEAFNERWENEFKSWEAKYKEEDSVEYELEEEDDFDISSFDDPSKEPTSDNVKQPETVDLDGYEDRLGQDNAKTRKNNVAPAITTGLSVATFASSTAATVNSINLAVKAAQAAELAAAACKAAAQGGVMLVNGAVPTMETANALSAASATSNAIGKALCFVGCALTLATGILYHATKPNKDAHQALMELKRLMTAGNADVEAQKLLMEQTQAEISDTAATTEDEYIKAEGEQETEQSELEQKENELAVKTELLLMATIVQESIRTRMQNGEDLSEADKAQFKTAEGAIQSLTEEISGLQGEISALQGNIIEGQENFEAMKAENGNEMDILQSQYGAQVSSFIQLQEISDLAASFDEATRDLCKSQIALQALNVASGTLNMLQAAKYGFLGIPFVAMALSGTVMSGVGIKEQSDFKKDIEGEIAFRTHVQENLTNSFNFFTSAVNQYGVDKGLVNSLELAVPETTTETDIPVETNTENPELDSPTENPTPTEGEDVVPTSGGNNPFIGSPNEDGAPTGGTTEGESTNEEPKKNPFAV